MKRAEPSGAFRIALPILVMAICSLALLAGRPSLARCQFDYDSASVGIFINNVAWHGQHDYGFDRSSAFQDRYRIAWAAQSLPWTVPAALAVRVLHVPPDSMETYLHVLALTLAIASALLAGRALCGGWRTESIFVAALTLLFPGMVLFVRTAVLPILIPFFLFWTSVALAALYAERRRAIHAYALGAAVGAFALSPYPPLLALPVAVAASYLCRRRLADGLRDKHVWGAMILAAVVYLLALEGVARAYFPSLHALRQQQAEFQRLRGGSIGLVELALPLGEKLLKFWHQHVTFALDTLGDQSRSDFVWTMGSPNLVWDALLLAGLLGVWKSWRQKSFWMPACTIAAVLLLFDSVSFSEGRYILVAVPCYAFFAQQGLTHLRARPFILALSIAAMSIRVGEQLVRHENVRVAREGVCEDWSALGRILKDRGRNDVAFTIDRTYGEKLLLRMLTDFDDEIGPPARAPQDAAGAIQIVPAGEAAPWRDAGWREVGRYAGSVDRRSTISLAVLSR